MDFTWIDVLIVVAVSLLIAAEVLITYQKHQMKKQSLKQMEVYDEED